MILILICVALGALIFIVHQQPRQVPIDPDYETQPSILDLQQRIDGLDYAARAELRWLHQRINEIRDICIEKERANAQIQIWLPTTEMTKSATKRYKSCIKKGCW